MATTSFWWTSFLHTPTAASPSAASASATTCRFRRPRARRPSATYPFRIPRLPSSRPSWPQVSRSAATPDLRRGTARMTSSRGVRWRFSSPRRSASTGPTSEIRALKWERPAFAPAAFFGASTRLLRMRVRAPLAHVEDERLEAPVPGAVSEDALPRAAAHRAPRGLIGEELMRLGDHFFGRVESRDLDSRLEELGQAGKRPDQRRNAARGGEERARRDPEGVPIFPFRVVEESGLQRQARPVQGGAERLGRVE